MDIIKELVLPPAFELVLALAGLLLMLRWRRIGAGLLAFAVLALYLLSLVPVSQALLVNLESFPPLPQTVSAAGYGAIVVLGAGRYPDAPEYFRDTVNAAALERLRYAARLRRKTGLPLLVSGGATDNEAVPEASIMNRVLAQDYGGAAHWLETASRNTMQNAVYSSRILRHAGIRRIYLVTHAVHMPRAVWAFRRQGMQVTPAPTVYGMYRLHAVHTPWFIPDMLALDWSRRALYEHLGMLWYEIKYQ